MPQKPKARSSKSKTTKPKETQEAQSARFVETARKIGVDESGREFERAFKKVVSSSGRRKVL
jgi:hypothetical protein